MEIYERLERLRKNFLQRAATPWFLWAELAVVAVASFFFFRWYQFASTHLCGTDPYYHIRFAALTRQRGVILSFPWAQLSLWRDHFFDKEFFYHLYLALFTFDPSPQGLITGAKWAVVGTGTTTSVVFFAMLRHNRIRYPWLWWLLLAGSGGYLLFRINVTRPQTLSVLLLLVGLWVLLQERVWLVGLLSFVYSLSYTGHYQYPGLAVIYYLVVGLRERRWPWRLALASVAGMLFGWLCHPNFPNNIKGFYVQNILVIWHHLHQSVDLHMGGELNPMTTRSLLGVNSATIIPLWLAFTAALARPWRVSTRTLFLFAASTVHLVLTLNTKRFAEYWIPVTTLFSASYFTDAPGEFTLGHWLKHRRWAFWLATTILVAGIPVLLYRSHKDTFRQLDRCGEPTYAPSARWVAAHIPKGEFVLTCDWDDAPYLFFYAPDHRYTVFLDPTFMYAWKPEVWHRWDDLTHAKLRDPVRVIRQEFGARWIYCTSDFGAFRNQLRSRPGARLVYPNPAPGSLGTPCATNQDCPEATVCKNPDCRPGKRCTRRTGRCTRDPHVFVYELTSPDQK